MKTVLYGLKVEETGLFKTLKQLQIYKLKVHSY